MELRHLDASTDLRARRLWDGATLRRLYQQRLRELVASEKRLETLPDDAAMVESFQLGRSIIRDLVLDPLLPDAICPSQDRQALVAAVRRYDRRGRLAWAGFLKRFDVPNIGTPLDGGHDLAPHRLAV
jgi:phenylacetic acid degradation operon negative regulatory protein